MDGNYKVVVESVPIQEPDAGGKLFSFSFPCSIFFFSFYCIFVVFTAVEKILKI